ncbi:MAG: NUDIX domain-containing protein [Candidatus Dormibacteria bacterium]
MAGSGRNREEVLVVARQAVFPDGAWHGFVTGGLESALAVIADRHTFLPRFQVEDDPEWQQVIPYIVFRHGERYLMTRRLRESSERRLHHLCSLGVGGHINRSDLTGGDPVQEGLRREWEEEVDYPGAFSAELIGLLNDDSSPVSRVHLGMVFLVEGDTPEIRVREAEKLSGELLTLEEMRMHYLEMESWSQLIYDHLLAGRRAPVLP